MGHPAAVVLRDRAGSRLAKSTRLANQRIAELCPETGPPPGGLSLATTGDFTMAVDTPCREDCSPQLPHVSLTDRGLAVGFRGRSTGRCDTSGTSACERVDDQQCFGSAYCAHEAEMEPTERDPPCDQESPSRAGDHEHQNRYLGSDGYRVGHGVERKGHDRDYTQEPQKPQCALRWLLRSVHGLR